MPHQILSWLLSLNGFVYTCFLIAAASSLGVAFVQLNMRAVGLAVLYLFVAAAQIPGMRKSQQE